MRILITGGSGLIGRALAANLCADYEIIILSRQAERIKNLPRGVRVERWDGFTKEGWHTLSDGAYAIINLAGENISSGRWSAKRKNTIIQSRLDAGRAIVEAVRTATRKPQVVIQSSGIGYYGPHNDEMITEESPPGHDFLARLAVNWEASAAPVETLGIRRVIVRTGVVLSSKGGALPRMLLPFRFYIGGRLGSGRQWFSWIHIADEVKAIRFLLENESARGPFNLTAPSPVTNGEFSRLMGEVLKRPALMPVPSLVLRLLFGEMSTALLDGQRAVPQRLLQLGFTFRFLDASSALKDLTR